METGDTVQVYQKPITKEGFEGNAYLIEQYRPDEGDGLSMWYVEFEGDRRTVCLRTINSTKIMAGYDEDGMEVWI